MGKERAGCLKWGCVGCIGVVVLTAVVIGGIMALGLMMGRPEVDIEPAEAARALPLEAGADYRLTPGGSISADDTEIGRLELDLSLGFFEVMAGPAGEPIRVEGEFDKGSYELTEEYEQSGDAGWVYRVRFRRSVSWVRHIFGEDASKNKIRIVVPRDAPFVLAGKIGIGESKLELGGLAVVATDLGLGIGEHSIEFDEPTTVPMSHFKISASVGEFRVGGLGNASPAKVEVRQRIGEINLDMYGEWLNDTEVSLVCGIGECGMRVPLTVNVDLERATMSIGERNVRALRDGPEHNPDLPTMKLTVRGRIGELRVSR